MAKTSSVQKNKNRTRLVKQYANQRARLKAIAKDRSLSPEEQFAARLKLAKLPRNSSKVRVHHRCEFCGRAKGYYRKVKLWRIALRVLCPISARSPV